MSKGNSSLIGRNVGNGRFTSVQKARNNPSTHVVNRNPKPGCGVKSSVEIGRDALSGRFVTKIEAKNNPDTAEVINLPKANN